MSQWIDDVAKVIAGGGVITLDEGMLGPELAHVCDRLRISEGPISLSSPNLLSSDGGLLDFKGTATGVLGGGASRLTVRLAEGKAGRRHCLVRIEADGLDDLVAEWLAGFEIALTDTFDPLAGISACVLSFTNLSRVPGTADAALSKGWVSSLGRETFGLGVTIVAARVGLSAELADGISKRLGADLPPAVISEGAAILLVAPPSASGDVVPVLHLRRAASTATLGLPGFDANIEGVTLDLPLEVEQLVDPRIRLMGEMTLAGIKPGRKLNVEAAVSLAAPRAIVRLSSAADLKELLDNSLKDSPVPEFLGGLLEKVSLDAWIMTDWPLGASSEPIIAAGISAVVDPENAFALIADRLEFAPSIALRIDYPMQPSERMLSGRLAGSLIIRTGDTAQPDVKIDASLDVPGWRFAAHAHGLTLSAMARAFGLMELNLPESVSKAAVDLTLFGDALGKSFAANLQIISSTVSWPGESPVGAWSLSTISLAVSFAEGALAFSVSATLTFHGFAFTVSGAYAGGWQLSGSMPEGAKLEVSVAINSLLQGLELPDGLPRGLVLRDVAFSADFSAGSYSVRGRTEGSWPIAQGFSVSVDALSVERTAGSIKALIEIGLTVADIPLVLEASTPTSSAEGWVFRGASRRGAEIGISDFVKALAAQAGATSELPAALPDFQIMDIDVSYQTAKSEIAFGCAGKLNVDGKAVSATITISYSGSDRTFAFAADVHVGELNFKGTIKSEGDDTTIVTSFHTDSPHNASLSNMLASLLPYGTPIPPIELGLKDALFVYDKRGTKSALLFGAQLDLDLTLNIDKVPLLNALVGNQPIGVDDLRVLLATAEFTAERIEAINATPQKLSFKLPEPKADDGKKGALAAGAYVSGNLKLGQQTPLPLSLPVGGDKAPPSSAPSAAEGATRPEQPEPAVEKQAQGPTKWFELGKSLGPLHVGRVGLQYADAKLGVLLDASVDLAGLHVGLTGFALRVPLSAPHIPSMDLDGLDLAYHGGPIEIAGAFLRHSAPKLPDRYDGLALLKAESFAVAGIGSFTTVNDQASLFIFAALHAELGGPPAFRIQGIAAGFGYNRKLILPPVDQVHQFPLVRAALDASFLGSGSPEDTIAKAMETLANSVTPSPGDYWIAAGIKFNSFELVTSVALLTVSFGNDVEIGLLGLMKMQLPRGADATPIAYVELALRASFRPRDGTLLVEGRLTEASYILSKDCRLTGGFALAFWFAGPHAGDFVITLGGYHPAFAKPDHYPTVPRLGIRWQVTNELLFAAELYFALTPTCIMAGGRLAAVYTSKTFRAWFIIHADFLIAWRPLHYLVEAGIRVGVEFDLGAIMLRIDLQVRIRIWGPPFAGRLDIDLGFLVASISFGAQEREVKPLEPSEFKQAFLPNKAADVVSLRIEGGLLHEGRTADDRAHVVRAHGLALAVQSIVPLTKFAFDGHEKQASGLQIDASELGIRPMAKASLTAPLTLKLVDGQTLKPVRLGAVKLDTVDVDVPEALWRQATKDEETNRRLPSVSRDRSSLRRSVGVRITLLPNEPENSLPAMRLEQLGHEDAGQKLIPPAMRAPPDSLPSALGSISAEGPNAAIIAVLKAQSPFSLYIPSLPETARREQSCFQAAPVICATGSKNEHAVPKAA